MSKLHWMALRTVSGVGGATARALVERFGDIEAAFEASDEELLAVPRVTSRVVAGLRAVSLEALEAEIMSLSEEDIQVVTWDDEEYPANLRLIKSGAPGPPVLFMRGDLHPEDDQAVAVVGTRHPTAEAVALAEDLARELAARGLTIVSGLAIGIDTAAHRGALRVEDGRTLAVLGSGLRAIHPRRNIALAEEIVGRGALLSECFPNVPPRGSSLMARDRIISGLSRAVIVVEAGEESGSVDTANKALRQGRLVFAVPGSPGTQALLVQGAERLEPQSVDFDRLSQHIQEVSLSDGSSPSEQLSLW